MQPAPIPIPELPVTGAVAWGVICVPLPPEAPHDVVAEVFGSAEPIQAVTAVATANVRLQWHASQPLNRRTETLHGFPIASPDQTAHSVDGGASAP